MSENAKVEHKAEFPPVPEGTARLVLEMKLSDAFDFSVTGNTPSLDIALAMVEQAKRKIEGQLRTQEALKLQQKMIEDQRVRQMMAGAARS